MALRLTSEDAVLPESCIVSFAAHFKKLTDDSLITILSSSIAGSHGLAGKPGNRSLIALRDLFIDFILRNRSTTGRTLQPDGRFHGAQYFLHSSFQQLKMQTKDGRKNLTPKNAIVQCVFGLACKEKMPHMDAPCGSWIRNMMVRNFGSHSTHGHTVMHPHSTDTCSTCSGFKVDTDSLNQQLKKHLSHGEDAGSIVRQQRIAEINSELLSLKKIWNDHKDKAAIAQKNYKDRRNLCRERYLTTCELWVDLILTQIGNALADAEPFVRLAALLEYGVDSDYQQDKTTPSWRQSDQPGPTYFMSKETNYVHIIIQHCLGSTTGDTRKQRALYMMRALQSV